MREKKYSLIIADPPWWFEHYGSAESQNSGMHTNSSPHGYPSLTQRQLIALRPPAADDAILFMWTISMYMKQAIELGEAWGFKYKTVAFVWVKTTTKGKLVARPGFYTMQGAEFCLLFTRGRTKHLREAHNIRQVVVAESAEHSRKPEEVRQRIVQLYGSLQPRLEMFARERASGWDVFGDQVDGSIKL